MELVIYLENDCIWSKSDDLLFLSNADGIYTSPLGTLPYNLYNFPPINDIRDVFIIRLHSFLSPYISEMFPSTVIN